ncbi:MAG: hypothetical protein EBT93_05835 [Alphaproteobacteria bacterium]|nr:hypothetical protein [Alphaproteobacteria bacterium]
MNPLNNYRFGSYAILAMGLINLRYQTGNDANLPKSLVLSAKFDICDHRKNKRDHKRVSKAGLRPTRLKSVLTLPTHH